MSGGMNRLLAVAIATGTLLVALVAPSAALAACGGGPSAQNVYRECLSGGNNHGHSGGGKSGGSNSSSPTQTGSSISPETAKALKQAGKQRRVLSSLVTHYGVQRLADPAPSGSETSNPSAIGSAFDLGSGPTALLLVLAGTAVVLLGGSGMRVWRGRHRQ